MRTKPAQIPALLLLAACAAQAQTEPHFTVLRYPGDRDTTIAVVAERPWTLGNLVDHIDERHYPGFAKALEQPHMQRYLTSDLMAPWVRHFADIKALEHITKDRNIDGDELEKSLSKRLKSDYEAYLAAYVEDLRQAGRPTELSQQRINRLLTEFQLHRGLAIELQGWLDHLEPEDYNRQQLHDYFTRNARAFGGQVTIAHILVQHRDAGTGILLREAGRGRASARLADIRARLKPDGSNFFEVARLFSEDSRTARDGGKIEGIRRFDDRLPAELCRAAWQLKDGEISDVVESRYGWHLIYRLEFNQNMFVLFTDDAIPSIKIVMQRARQEALMFGAREAARVDLKF